MTYEETMNQLQEMGTDQNIKVYKRHGAGENLYGVSFANLKILKKKIKVDHELALQLWESKNTDAQTLALMVIDPSQVTEEEIDTWVKEITYYMLADLFCGYIVSKTEWAEKKVEEWTPSNGEYIKRCGYATLAELALETNDLPDSYFEEFIPKIENEIHESKNRAKQGMNNTLIAIGARSDNLEKKATEAAERIGKVEVDHGETWCKTPFAVPYIKKARDHRRKKESKLKK